MLPSRHVPSVRRRGSGLIIALGVLAMLAIMATTFITLMRLNARLSRAFNDDLQVEMLAQGVANYCIGVLREDQDRTMYKYANRTGVVGGRGWWQGMGSYDPNGSNYITDFSLNIPGRNTDYWAAARVGGHDTSQIAKPGANGAPADHAYGTGPSHAVWYSAATDGYWESGLYSNSAWYEYNQASFGGSSMDFIIVNRYDKIVANALNPAPLGTGAETYYACVYGHRNGISDLSASSNLNTIQKAYALDGSNTVWETNEPYYVYGPTADNPVDHWDYAGNFWSEINFLGNYCYDSAVFLTHGLTSHLHPGGKLTQTWDVSGGLVNQSGMMRLPNGLFWRWSAKMGVPEERYMNLNAIGNSELALSSGVNRLNNLDGNGLQAMNGDTSCRTGHLGMISWKGYPSDTGSYGKFDQKYDSVTYSPYQLDPYRLLAMDVKDFNGNTITYGDKLLDPAVYPVANICSQWISQRWGSSLAANGEDYYRPGWRRDGASYYKIPSPDNPQGNDWYYGASEALNHQDEDIIPQSSRLFNAIYTQPGQNLNTARAAFDKTRGYLSTYGCDTILRGKIWPGEGNGNWRNMDVLRKVNLNMLGACAGDALSGNNVKGKWANLAGHERDRLYYMLKAMLQFTGTPDVQHQACQFVASLTDMVSWNNNETCYVAPDGSGAWAVGMKKNPVINEVAFISNSASDTVNYKLFRLRVELYNPCENIPWIPDSDEAYDVSQYVLQVANHYDRLGTLHKFVASGASYTDAGTVDTSPNNKIGADGLYGLPVAGYCPAASIAADPSWSRYLHVGWVGSGGGTTGEFPAGVSQTDFQGGSNPVSSLASFTGVTLTLWKPVSVPASVADTAYLKSLPGFSGRYMMVDTTNMIKLIRPWDPSKGEGGPGQIASDPDGCPARDKTLYSSVYRRWDPMNANVYEDPTLGKNRYGKGDKGSVVWCPGWSLFRVSTLGRPNVDYWGGTQNMFQYDDAGTVGCPVGGTLGAGKYQRVFETDYKVPCCDLPSVGWLGELFLWNCAQNGPLTLASTSAQRPDPTGAARYTQYTNRVENAKLDLFRPWGRVHNLHLYDMFTVWDPMHDGIDNDGDGAVDEDDTGYQAGDLLGPEVRVYGCVDVNHVGVKTLSNLQPGQAVPGVYGFVNTGRPYDRGNNGAPGDWQSEGPAESIGDILRIDDLRGWPGGSIGVFQSWNCPDGNNLYRSSYNLSGSATNDYWGQGTPMVSWVCKDDDSNGILDERDERDYWFTQMSNFMTTRANVFTVEVVAQVTDPPWYPGNNYLRGAYKIGSSGRVYAEKHLIMLVDRTTTLRFKNVGGVPGPADFTGPCRLLARRWGHDRK